MALLVNEEMWFVDGAPLSTWAYNVESIGGRQGIPVMAGDNYQVPYRAGEVWRSKMPAARTLSLGMWIRSTDANGLTSKTATGRRAQFNENFRFLKNIFYNRDRLLTVTKNVRYFNGIQAFTTQAECVSDLEPQMSGPNFGKMVVDLKMVDPYWTAGSLTQTIGATLSGININNPGDDYTHRMSIQVSFISGGGGSTVIKNMSYSPPITLSVPTPGAGIPWTIDVENFFLSRAGDLTTNWQNSINRSGPSAFWFEFKKGNNLIVVDSRFGDGSFNNLQVAFTYYPLYI